MADTTLQVYSVLFVLAGAVLYYSARFFQARRQARGERRRLRHIAGFARLAGWVGQSIESNRPLHLSFGGAGLGEESGVLALANAELFYQIVRAGEAGDAAPLVSMSAAATIPLGQDALRRARPADQPAPAANLRWYPQGPRSIAYAAAVTAMLADEKLSAHVLSGSFGPELALILDSAHHRGEGTFAGSDQLEGQAAAYAMADEVLIGEELFVAAAYLSADPAAQTDAVVLDVWRMLLIIILSGLLLNLAQQVEFVSGGLVLAGFGLLLLFGIGALAIRRQT